MFIEITKVLKTSDGVQRFVQYRVDQGNIITLGINEFLLYAGQHVNSRKNFVVVNGTSVRGKDCNLAFAEILTRDEMAEKYPDRYVALQNTIHKRSSPLSPVVYGEVVSVIKDEDYGKVRAQQTKEGKNYIYLRTTSVKGPFCGVML